MNFKVPFKITFWRVVLILIWLAGIVATIVRFTGGLGAATNLSDRFPWGLWIGFDVLCGIGLAAGGFTIAAIVYIFRIKRFYPVLRPALLTAFLGYLMEIVAVLFDLGMPLRIWHPVIWWNPRSALFVVGWCVMLYTTILALEFSPALFERLSWGGPRKWIGRVTVPLVIAGVIISTLHQSSLGSLYLIMPEKLHPFWYSPLLPFLFFLSAVAVGCAMVIFESHLSYRAFGHRLKLDVLADLGRVILVTLVVYMILRIQDFSGRGVWAYAFQNRTETLLFWLEALVGVIGPIILLSIKRIRLSARGLYYVSVCTITGFLLNRLNVAVTGMEASAGMRYFPSWMEVAITLAIVATEFFIFALAVRYLPVFEHPETDSEPETAAARPEVLPAQLARKP
ncbi:MAG: Ni/Fe-hydrogenase cytochrome b subunit [Candidatus Zixiibacteriota bacterium]|nr:MAG: Ni/Fe-hydrogenase cytochrome b subunit [candidate division Zixibacteria bacterium]